MNPNEKIIRFATGAQCAQLSGMVAVALAKKFDGALSFSQAQIAITDKDQFEVNELAEKFANEIFAVPINPWTEEMRKISHFYKTCFKDKKWKNPDLEHVVIPTIEGNLKRPEFIFKGMTEKEAIYAFSDYFGNKVWGINININTETIQPRPNRNYIMMHAGGNVPDILGKNYDDGVSKKIIFMTPLEGIISAFRWYFETREMYGMTTILSALDRRGSSIRMYADAGGLFGIDNNYRNYRSSKNGLRQVNLF